LHLFTLQTCQNCELVLYLIVCVAVVLVLVETQLSLKLLTICHLAYVFLQLNSSLQVGFAVTSKGLQQSPFMQGGEWGYNFLNFCFWKTFSSSQCV